MDCEKVRLKHIVRHYDRNVQVFGQTVNIVEGLRFIHLDPSGSIFASKRVPTWIESEGRFDKDNISALELCKVDVSAMDIAFETQVYLRNTDDTITPLTPILEY